jgi:hypothetical protein
MNTPTPRTDALYEKDKYTATSRVYGNMHEHAIQLERELDEARNRITHLESLSWYSRHRAVCAQRDALAMSYGELIAAVRVNAMRDTFREATVDQIDGWLKPWVDKLAAVKGEQP